MSEPNWHEIHKKHILSELAKEEANSACEFLALDNRIIYCEKVGKGKTAACMMDRQSAGYIPQELCEIKGR